MDVIEKAKELALLMHKPLLRPNKAQQPTTEHLEEVALLVSKAGGTDEMIASAWLHDIVEDTEITLKDINDFFGATIADMVDGLTDPEGLEKYPTAERKKMQADRLVQKSREIRIIKLSDQISNVRSVWYDPPLDWDSKKSLTYIEGAKKIALICEGLSTFLDEEFNKVYDAAKQRYA